MASSEELIGRGASEQDYLPACSTAEDINEYFVIRDAQKLFFDSVQETLDIYWHKKWEKFTSLHTMEEDAFQMCRIKLVKHMPRLDEMKSKWWTYSTLISRTALLDFQVLTSRRMPSFVSKIEQHAGITQPRHGIVRLPVDDECGDVDAHVPSIPSYARRDRGNSGLMDMIPCREGSALDGLIRQEQMDLIMQAVDVLISQTKGRARKPFTDLKSRLSGGEGLRIRPFDSIILKLSDAVAKIQRDRDLEEGRTL